MGSAVVVSNKMWMTQKYSLRLCLRLMGFKTNAHFLCFPLAFSFSVWFGVVLLLLSCSCCRFQRLLPSDINKPAIHSETLVNTIHDPPTRNRTVILLSPNDYYPHFPIFSTNPIQHRSYPSNLSGIDFLLPPSRTLNKRSSFSNVSSPVTVKEKPFPSPFFM